jgi:hypothetical protein
MREQIRRPVDISAEFKQNGMTLITDPASDRYLNAYSKLATSQQETTEEKTQTTSDEGKA